MRSTLRHVIFLALACAARLHAGQAEGPDVPLIAIDEGRVYRKLNDEAITGKDIINLLLEESWDKVLQTFIDYMLAMDDVKANKIEIADAEVEKEVQALQDTLDEYNFTRSANV